MCPSSFGLNKERETHTGRSTLLVAPTSYHLDHQGLGPQNRVFKAQQDPVRPYGVLNPTPSSGQKPQGSLPAATPIIYL